MNWKALTVGFFGLWLLIDPFFMSGIVDQSWNNIIVGIGVLFLGIGLLHDEPQQAWIAGTLGAWLVISAFIPVLVSGIGLYLNNVFFGLVIIISGFSAFLSERPV